MQKKLRRRLEKDGWTVGDPGDFLGLSDGEIRVIETKLALAAGLRRRREKLGLTQSALARRLGSSQSRVAKMEAADGSVSLDLLFRGLFLLGVSRQEAGRGLTWVRIAGLPHFPDSEN
jgi:DNA-binding XRE family transcriptional regulator